MVDPTMPRIHRTFAALANGAELRTAEFEGVSHIVVPVVALIGDTIVRPMNSAGPEYIPIDELYKVPEGWNYRACVLNHPHGGTASANDPRTLERFRFGNVFDSRVEDGKLKMNAYLDPAKAEKVGPDAVRVIDRCRAGEQVEVSVGAYISAEHVDGVAASGEPYSTIWKDIVPDHLAFLAEGSIGACSVEMGCGAPRVNSSSKPSADNSRKRAQLRAAERKAMKKDSKMGRFLSFFRLAQADEEMSDNDLRNTLWDAISKIEPGFDWVVDIFQESGTVIYTVNLNHQSFLYYRRTFVVTDDGVTLNDDREQVEPVMRYEVVSETGSVTVMTSMSTSDSPCSCKTTGQSAQGENMSNTKSELIGRVIACGRNPFKEKDRKTLEALDEEQLQQLVDGAKEEEKETAAPTPVATGSPAAPVAPAAPAVTPETLGASSWEEVRSMVGAHRATVEAERSSLVAAIGATTDEYTVDELKAMTIPSLTKLSRALQIDVPKPNYLGRGGALVTASSHEPPDPWADKKAPN